MADDELSVPRLFQARMKYRFPIFGRSASGFQLGTLVMAMFAAATWIATHRYLGIWHDGMFYAGQAVFHLDSTPFANDLFFAYGSQDGFTFFTQIYAFAIFHLGLPIASSVLLASAHVVWFSASAWLLRAVFGGWAFWLALVLVAVLPATYGSYGLLSYGEVFLTARSWAEGPALLAVAFVLRGHRVAAVASVAFSAAMHPVIAFPAALFVFLFGFDFRQQGVFALLGLLTIVALNLAGIPPFADLNKTMDPVWLALSVERSPFVFLAQWATTEYKETGLLALLLTTAALVNPSRNKRLWWCAIGVFSIGMGLALLVTYWPGVLLVQMQPWRVLWLVRILAIAAGVSLLQTAYSSSPYNHILLGALVASALHVASFGIYFVALLAGLIVARNRFAIELRLPLWFRLLAWGSIILVIGESIFWRIMLSSVSLDFTEPVVIGLTRADRLFIISKEFGWFVFAPLLCAIWLLLRHRPASSRWLVLVCSTLLIYLASSWQRTTHNQAEEAFLQETGFSELTSIIQPQHLTYWAEELPNLWLIFHRGSYASFHQSAGLIFSRETAIESYRRLSRLEKLGFSDSRFGWVPKATGESPKTMASLDGLIHVCHDPILDFVVLSRHVAGTIPVKTFRLSSFGDEFHLYACASLRAFPDPFPSSS